MVELKKKLNFSNECTTYAVYLLKEIKGTRNRRGSVPAEQNHSSVILFLNCGEKGMDQCCKLPIKLIKELFSRQKRFINKLNELLTD